MDEQQQLLEILRSRGIDTPEKIQELALAAQTPELMALAGQDYSTGLGLTQTPSAEGQRVGNTYVAANPLEHLAVALNRGIGAQKMKGAQSEMDRLVKALANQKGLDIFGRAGGQAAFQPPPQVPQSPQPIDPEWQGIPFPFPG